AGRFGGWSVYLKEGKPMYTYNFLGLEKYRIASPKPLPAGKATIRYEFVYEGSGLGKGGAGTLLVNGEKVAEGKIARTQPNVFSADEGADVGQDGETPVTDDYPEGNNRFTGKIHKVVVEIAPLKLAARERAELHDAEVARRAAE